MLMSVINFLLNKNKWCEFLEYKLTKSHLTKLEEQQLIEFVKTEKYLSVANQIVLGTYSFSVPNKVQLNKSGTSKKRTVYTFNETENIILKFILFCMSDYDDVFFNNCFSFRKNLTIKDALFSLIKNKNINQMYAYKLDISNYFNSIDVCKLLPMLKTLLSNDLKLLNLLESILIQDKAIFNGEQIKENRGVMAGTPLSTFLANLYLSKLDEHFYNGNIIYARYSDDIIVFAPTLNQLAKHKQYILKFLTDKGLTVNNKKEFLFAPHTPWHFLGFEYCDGIIDLSDVTVTKIKSKIRRKARALYRWKIKNNKSTEHVLKVMLRVFNSKFYKTVNNKDFTWCKWFFPVITTHKKLEIIDDYLVQYLRYLETGRFSKQNYNIKYSYLKQLGFKSLVNEFYKFNK